MRRKKEKAQVLEKWKRQWSQPPLSGHFGHLTNVVNPSRIDNAEESEEKSENASEKKEDSGEGENESREGG